MQSMASVVQPLPRRLEATCVSPDDGLLFDDHNPSPPALTEPVRGPYTCGPTAEYNYRRQVAIVRGGWLPMNDRIHIQD